MTVRNWRSRLVEKYQYITPDGLVYELHDPPSRAVLFFEGDGFAVPVYETTRGPFQHGVNVTSFRLEPRQMDIILRHNGCSREDYWTKRGTLTDFLRYSRTDANNPQAAVLRRVLANGNVRDLDVYLTKVPVFINPKGWDHFSFQEKLELTAFNPIAYDPTEKTLSATGFTPTSTVDQNLVFGITFPIYFGVSTTSLPITKTITVPYLGNWEEYPTIVIQGPATSIQIVHQQTGALLELEGYSFTASETITFNLKYGFKTVINNFGVSLLGYISADSDLTQFNIQPDPLVSGGVNTFDVTIGGGGSDTSILITYKDRYMSID